MKTIDKKRYEAELAKDKNFDPTDILEYTTHWDLGLKMNEVVKLSVYSVIETASNGSYGFVVINPDHKLMYKIKKPTSATWKDVEFKAGDILNVNAKAIGTHGRVMLELISIENIDPMIDVKNIDYVYLLGRNTGSKNAHKTDVDVETDVEGLFGMTEEQEIEEYNEGFGVKYDGSLIDDTMVTLKKQDVVDFIIRAVGEEQEFIEVPGSNYIVHLTATDDGDVVMRKTSYDEMIQIYIGDTI